MGNSNSSTNPAKTSKSSTVITSSSTQTSAAIRSRLENAAKSRVLQLKGSNLKTVPPIIEQVCETIRTLDLSQNKISDCPIFIGKFSSLKQLHFSSNRLVMLPAEIGNLKALELLDLSSNSLSQLPETLSGCSSLTLLNLSNNKFSIFPSVVTKLKRLETINLSDNLITALPNEASDLSCVELNLSKNRLSDVHQNLSLCKNLKILRLDENCLQKEAFSKELLEGSNISLITYAGNLFLEKEFQALPGYNSYEQRFTTTKRKIM